MACLITIHAYLGSWKDLVGYEAAKVEFLHFTGTNFVADLFQDLVSAPERSVLSHKVYLRAQVDLSKALWYLNRRSKPNWHAEVLPLMARVKSSQVWEKSPHELLMECLKRSPDKIVLYLPTTGEGDWLVKAFGHKVTVRYR